MIQLKAKTYTGEGFSVTFEAGKCIHAGACLQGLPKVFNLNAKPWVNTGAAPADTIEEVVARCPTDALTFQSDKR